MGHIAMTEILADIDVGDISDNIFSNIHQAPRICVHCQQRTETEGMPSYLTN